MGRKAPSGLLPVTAIVLGLVVLSACHGRGKENLDPSVKFRATGEKRTRNLGIYSGKQRVGTYDFARTAGTWNDGVQATEMSEILSLRLSFRGDSFTVKTSQVSWLDENLGLLGGISEVDFGAGKWGNVWCRLEDGRYVKSETVGGRSTGGEVDVPPGMLTTNALNLYLHNLPEAGLVSRKMEFFNLTLGRALPIEIVFRGRDGAMRGFSVSFWGMDEEIWLDGDGMVVKETLPWGVEAFPPSGNSTVGSLPLEKVLAQTAVPVRNVPRDMATLERVSLRIQGSVNPPPATLWQAVSTKRGHVMVDLRRPEVPPLNDRPEMKEALNEDDLGLDLQSPRIAGLARAIAGGLDDPWKRAQAVGRWVFANLGKSMRECFSALEVLEAGEGECQSHSLLTVALSRSAGVPARFVYGVVYMPDRDAYLYHTWVEVFAGEWIPIDPTLGSFPAGVDHLTLVRGGYRDQFSMFPYILGEGGWSVEFVDGE